MEVILRVDYPQLGFVGQRVRVRPGYARNYLIPQGLAIETSARSAGALEHERKQLLKLSELRRQEAEKLRDHLQGLNLDFTLKLGESGKSYGSIGSRDITARLAELGYEIDRRQVRLASTVKATGSYQAELRLHRDVQATISFSVTADQSSSPAALEAEVMNQSSKQDSDLLEEEEALASSEAE